ncbi:MAG: energy transducer TonB [Pseudomonadota bacterium]
MKTIIKTLTVGGLITISLSACTQGISGSRSVNLQNEDGAEITNYIAPVFPEAAAKSCEAGQVLLEYDVAHTGEVKSDSVKILADAGSSALADAAIEAISRWKYSPLYEDGALLERSNLRTAVTFEIEGCDPATY